MAAVFGQQLWFVTVCSQNHICGSAVRSRKRGFAAGLRFEAFIAEESLQSEAFTAESRLRCEVVHVFGLRRFSVRRFSSRTCSTVLVCGPRVWYSSRSTIKIRGGARIELGSPTHSTHHLTNRPSIPHLSYFPSFVQVASLFRS